MTSIPAHLSHRHVHHETGHILHVDPITGDIIARKEMTRRKGPEAQYQAWAAQRRADANLTNDHATAQASLSKIAPAERHDRVLKDARKMLEELGLIGVVKTDASSFVETSYQNSQNKAQPMVIFDKELTFTLIAGYSVKLRHLIVKRWLELEGFGFERVSVQAAVVHLIEREKDNRQAALQALKKASKKTPRSPLSAAEKERQRLNRLAYRSSQKGF